VGAVALFDDAGEPYLTAEIGLYIVAEEIIAERARLAPFRRELVRRNYERRRRLLLQRAAWSTLVADVVGEVEAGRSDWWIWRPEVEPSPDADG
jgi:hypothetical protein